jgi:hypothetical protein
MSEKRANPGQAFEDAFRASIPKGAYVRRLRTPTAMGSVVPRLVGLIESLSATLRVPVPEWVRTAARFRFTPKAGYDLLVTAPCGALDARRPTVHGPGWVCRFEPSVLLALELKSVEGISIPWDNVDRDQEKALLEAADRGGLAFLVIEFRRTGEVWALPIEVWRDTRLVAPRASLPLADARRLGIQIYPDPGRGATRQYWNVEAFLRQCGASFPAGALAKRSRGGAASVLAPPPPEQGSL